MFNQDDGFAAYHAKSLDRFAYMAIGLTLLLVALALYGRFMFSQAQLDQRIAGLSVSPDQQLWISLPSKVVVTDAYGDIKQQHDWSAMGVSEPTVNWLFAPTQIWMRTVSGDVYRCPLTLTGCLPVKRVWSSGSYASLSLSANGQFVTALSNHDGNLYLLDASTGALIRNTSSYETRTLDIVNAPSRFTDRKGLYKANGSWSDQQSMVLANTGFYRLDRWPLLPTGAPDFAAMPQTILQTQGQPYFIEAFGQGDQQHWYVLEGEMSLDHGWLNHYLPKGAQQNSVRIQLPIADPISMVRLDDDVLIANMAKPEIVRVGMSGQQDQATDQISALNSPDLMPVFRDILQHQTWFERFSELCLVLMALLPLGLVLLLKQRGYNLNQAL
jgi:hypothetical protein